MSLHFVYSFIPFIAACIGGWSSGGQQANMDFSFAVLSRADRWHSYRHTPASLSLSLSLSRSLSLSLSLSLAHTYPHKRTHRRLVRRSLICSLARRLVRSAPDAWARQKEEVCLVSIAIPTQGRQLEQTRSELGAWEACHTHSCKRSSACSAHTHTHKHAHIHTHKHTHTQDGISYQGAVRHTVTHMETRMLTTAHARDNCPPAALCINTRRLTLHTLSHRGGQTDFHLLLRWGVKPFNRLNGRRFQKVWHLQSASKRLVANRWCCSPN